MIGASFGLGTVLDKTGASSAIANAWLDLAGQDPWMLLFAVYLLTSLLMEVVTNNAAVVLMFYIAKSAAVALDVNFTPFVFAIMIAASASFATPIGCQTNLMVPGDTDFPIIFVSTFL